MTNNYKVEFTNKYTGSVKDATIEVTGNKKIKDIIQTIIATMENEIKSNIIIHTYRKVK